MARDLNRNKVQSLDPDDASPSAYRTATAVQRLWFTLAKRPWTFLVLMPSHERGSTVQLGQELARIGTQHRGTPVRFIDASGVGVGNASTVIVDALEQPSPEAQTLMAVDSPLFNPSAIPIAMAADALLLCVELGEADSDSARQTLDAVGAERFVGSVTVRKGTAA